MPRTNDTPFFSKSTRIGSSRWLIPTLPGLPLVKKGYVLDLGFMQGLPYRFYVVTLSKDPGPPTSGYTISAYSLGARSDTSGTLVPAELAQAVQQPPTVTCTLIAATDVEAITRFERVVSNIMHNLIEPTAKVQSFWQRIADMPV
jgi:hypothetical protein